MDEVAQAEQEKYTKVWTHDVYRRMSPGFKGAKEILPVVQRFTEAGVSRILDAGCGSGKLMKYLDEHEFSVCGLDIAENCLDDDVPEHCTLTVGNLWDADTYPEGPFEAVCCNDVLEHIPTENVPQVLKALRGVDGVKIAYFSVALFKDGYGPKLLGEPLHLTVKPSSWWMGMFNLTGWLPTEVHKSKGWLHIIATAD